MDTGQRVGRIGIDNELRDALIAAQSKSVNVDDFACIGLQYQKLEVNPPKVWDEPFGCPGTMGKKKEIR